MKNRTVLLMTQAPNIMMYARFHVEKRGKDFFLLMKCGFREMSNFSISWGTLDGKVILDTYCKLYRFYLSNPYKIPTSDIWKIRPKLI